jgi:glycosyltransferase involved in cell wall biosynthesis
LKVSHLVPDTSETSNVDRQKSNIKVIAAIPCLNTEQTIADVVTKTLKYVNEVIVVDDGSKDKTAEVAKAAGARVISHIKNEGKGAAMKTAAESAECDILVFIDGDAQHNPEEIPLLLEPIIKGNADFVIGSRYLVESKVTHNPFMRKTANSFASFVISFTISIGQPISRIFNRKPISQKTRPPRSDAGLKKLNYRILNGRFKWISDCTSGFTAMRKENWNKLNLISDGFQIETEMIFEQSKNGFIIGEIPISCKWGESASKLLIARDGLKTVSLLIIKLFNYS